MLVSRCFHNAFKVSNPSGKLLTEPISDGLSSQQLPTWVGNFESAMKVTGNKHDQSNSSLPKLPQPVTESIHKLAAVT